MVVGLAVVIIGVLALYYFHSGFQQLFNRSLSLIVYEDRKGMEILLYQYNDLSFLISLFLLLLAIFILPLSTNGLATVLVANTLHMENSLSFSALWLCIIILVSLLYVMLYLTTVIQRLSIRTHRYFLYSVPIALLLAIIIQSWLLLTDI